MQARLNPVKFFTNAITTRSAVAVSKDTFPQSSPSFSEIAFGGRSNVGKSSLINCLTNNKKLAKTSKTAGRTQKIFFYRVGETPLMLVDLPGYGFAKAPKKVVHEMSDLVGDFIIDSRPSLKSTCLLVDSRRGLMETDLHMMEFLLNCKKDFWVTLTKSDKLKPHQIDELIFKTKETVGLAFHLEFPVLPVSAKSKEGIDELREMVLNRAELI